jgi:hypothetical protein
MDDLRTKLEYEKYEYVRCPQCGKYVRGYWDSAGIHPIRHPCLEGQQWIEYVPNMKKETEE